MSRKIFPVLIAAVGALFLALVLIIAVQLTDPQKRSAAKRRSEAVRTLLGLAVNDPLSASFNLRAIAGELAAPYSAGGDLDNLLHYLQKDPGRRDFARIADRRRAEEYFGGEMGVRAAERVQAYSESALPSWAPAYLAAVQTLFERAEEQIILLMGVPEELTSFPLSVNAPTSMGDSCIAAVARFAENWLPPGQSSSAYGISRVQIRSFLMGRRRFAQRMNALDASWRELIAVLYNLKGHPHWRIAAGYDSSLDDRLDDLIVHVLTADIHRRNRDLMEGVADAARQTGEPPSPGILWTPNLSYYKNIPEITGQTADEIPTIFFAKVNLGYTFQDNRTQIWLNRRKDWLTDHYVSFLSDRRYEDFSPLIERNRELSKWRLARIKAEGIHPINLRIAASLAFGSRKVHGVRDMALVRVNLLGSP